MDALNAKIELKKSKNEDVTALLTLRAEYLLNKQGALGSVLADCDEVLLSSSTKDVESKMKLYEIRGLILAFLGADSLAIHDLKMCKGGRLFGKVQAMDCPEAFVCSAADWHRARRLAMLRRYPELKMLYDTPRDAALTCAMMLLLILVHVVSAWVVSEWNSILGLVLLSSTSGAVTAYGFQALTHELGHMALNTKFPRWIGFAFAAAGSSFTNFPWHFYYWNYHNRHHAHAGGERDRDGDILFHAWHNPPILFNRLDFSAQVATKWLWTVFFAFAIYPMFCKAKATLDSPHFPSLLYEGWNLLTYFCTWYFLGWYSVVFYLLSAACSLGAFGHPFIQFWLTQHAFIRERRSTPYKMLILYSRKNYVPLLQPTCSDHSASSFWHALNFGELRHVEHHDFPLIPYLRAYQLKDICPEFYTSLDSALGPFAALQDWLGSTGNLQKSWMRLKGDFAGRNNHLKQLWELMEQYEVDNGIDENAFDEDGKGNEEEPLVQWNEEEDNDDEELFVERGRS